MSQFALDACRRLNRRGPSGRKRDKLMSSVASDAHAALAAESTTRRCETTAPGANPIAQTRVLVTQYYRLCARISLTNGRSCNPADLLRSSAPPQAVHLRDTCISTSHGSCTLFPFNSRLAPLPARHGVNPLRLTSIVANSSVVP